MPYLVINKTIMKAPYVSIGRALSRRKFLRSVGVGLALPMLDAMTPIFGKSRVPKVIPRRMLAIDNNLGLLANQFFPTESGMNYALSPYLEKLKEFKNDFTVFSGVSHPSVDGGHNADICFLSCAPHPGGGGFKNTISLDQYMAENIGHHTRIPSLILGVNVKPGGRGISWTESGVMIPVSDKTSEIFKEMFIQGTPEEVEEQVRQLERGQSILDVVSGRAKELKRNLGAADRDRMDQYFTSVRELEKRMEAGKEWAYRDKPKVSSAIPLDPGSPKEYMQRTALMYEMASLAFQTDSTRVISLLLDSVSTPAFDYKGYSLKGSYHDLSHHGKSEAKIKQLKVIDLWHMELLAKLFEDLKSIKEEGETLLDRSMVFYGSSIGNAHAHTNTNMPVIFAGGGFKHGQHLAFDPKRNYPLPNLFVSMLQRMGIEADKFASSTGTMRGLEMQV